MTDAGFQLGEARLPLSEMLRWVTPLGTEAAVAALLFFWFYIIKTNAKLDLSFFNGVLVAKLLVVTWLLGPYSSNLTEKFCLGHGWQIFYHNHALLVRYNFYISLCSFKQQMAEFSTTEAAWKSPFNKEVKAWFSVLRCFFFCRVRIFSQTSCPDCPPLFLWMIPLCFFPL